MRVLVFGNEDVESDSLAMKVADILHIDGVEFIKCASPDNLESHIENGKIIIMDVAKNVDKITFLRDANNLRIGNLCSCHDFDVAFHIKLLKELGKLDNVIVIALPMKGKIDEIEGELTHLLPDNI